jgi:hypothetical protein
MSCSSVSVQLFRSRIDLSDETLRGLPRRLLTLGLPGQVVCEEASRPLAAALNFELRADAYLRGAGSVNLDCTSLSQGRGRRRSS